MTSEARGEVYNEDGVLVLRRIEVTYRLAAPEQQRETVERVHAIHARYCPVYRSITPSIEVTTALELLGEGAAAEG